MDDDPEFSWKLFQEHAEKLRQEKKQEKNQD
jgi:hypothetical protein